MTGKIGNEKNVQVNSRKKTHGWSPLTPLHLFGVIRHVVRSNGLQELHVIIRVIFSHFLQNCLVRSLKNENKIFDQSLCNHQCIHVHSVLHWT